MSDDAQKACPRCGSAARKHVKKKADGREFDCCGSCGIKSPDDPKVAKVWRIARKQQAEAAK